MVRSRLKLRLDRVFSDDPPPADERGVQLTAPDRAADSPMLAAGQLRHFLDREVTRHTSGAFPILRLQNSLGCQRQLRYSAASGRKRAPRCMHPRPGESVRVIGRRGPLRHQGGRSDLATQMRRRELRRLPQRLRLRPVPTDVVTPRPPAPRASRAPRWPESPQGSPGIRSRLRRRPAREPCGSAGPRPSPGPQSADRPRTPGFCCVGPCVCNVDAAPDGETVCGAAR